MSTPIPDDIVARLIHEALEQLGWQQNPNALAELVRRLNIGLPSEDELSVVLSWLGNCRLIHKLDQLQTPPSSKSAFQVPDLLAIFNHQGVDIPVLIEAKSKKGQSLSWRPDYYEGLQRYGSVLRMPVLVAWKFHRIWILFDLRHFKKAQKNYNIKFETAMKQSLMGILAGDFAYSFKRQVGFHILFRKERLIKETQGGDTTNQEWQTRVEQAYFSDGQGKHVSNLAPGLWPLFLSYEQEDTMETTETHITQSFIVSQESSIQFAHMGIVRLWEFFSSGESSIKWREILRNYKVPTSRTELRKAAEMGIKTNFIQKIIDQLPETRPDFLNK